MALEIKIHPELESYLPSLALEHSKHLKESIRAEGRVRDPLILWEEEGCLVDGHNRWRSVQELRSEGHQIPDPDVERVSFADLDAVKMWMDRNALGRRNLSAHDQLILVGRLYKAEKKKQGAPEGNSNRKIQSAQNEHFETKPLKTAEKVARETGVSQATVRRSEKYVDNVEAIKREAGPRAEQQIKEAKLTMKEVKEVAQAPDKPKALEAVIASRQSRPERAARKKGMETEVAVFQIREYVRRAVEKLIDPAGIDQIERAILELFREIKEGHKE